MEALQQEMIEDALMQREELRRELADQNASEKAFTLNKISALDKLLGDKATAAPTDDLWDQWEADLEAGRAPDLNAKPGGSR